MDQTTHATELSADSLGLSGQVIIVVDAPRGHIPILKCFKVLRLNSKSKTLHKQWTDMILIWKPLNLCPILPSLSKAREGAGGQYGGRAVLPTERTFKNNRSRAIGVARVAHGKSRRRLAKETGR